MAWLEEYFVRKRFGWTQIDQLAARDVEAFVILEHEMASAATNA
jgi:hypothetical protein